jgi:DNA (cytosine-5)-methyltransferase 1
MNHGSLFSGIGGFDLAAEWMGWNNTFHCEWMPFPRKVLNHYWPNSISYEDITKTDFTIHRGTIDILTGGFPCQPYSSAGKRLGKEDERHLWPHMLRVISEVKPTYVVGENVRGLTNWNGGVVFEEVCVDLESQGYTVQPILLPACSVGAPHRRDRVWFIAYSRSNGLYDKSKGISERENTKFKQRNSAVERLGFEWNATNSNGLRQHERECDNEEHSSERRFNALNDINKNDGFKFTTNTERKRFQSGTNSGEIRIEKRNMETKRNKSSTWLTSINKQSNWNNFPTQSPICGGDDGLPTKLDGITFPKWRQESIKGYGNAIVPQVAYEIFKVIAEMDRLEKLQLKLF